MDTAAFLRHVLPPTGKYATIVINKGGAPQQAFFDSVDELASTCLRSDRFKNNTYYAVSSFRTRFSRKQDNVHLTKALFLDIDCVDDDKHQYKSQKEGLAALIKFLAATKLPKPLIVSSGRGLHVYWVLGEALPPEEWQPLADALKATFQVNGFDFDPAVTADSARVLRPVGTHNPKNGNEITVLMDAPTYTKQALQNILGSAKPTLVAQTAAPAPRKSALAAALSVVSDFPPAPSETVATECLQIAWALKNPEKVAEPMWYSLIGVAAHCTNPEGTAKAWSKGHPDYSEAETLRKLVQWQAQTTGPATCSRFVSDRPKGCAGCPTRDKINTPARLGMRHNATVVSDDAPDAEASKLPLPWNYKRTKQNGVEAIVCSTDKTDIDVCPFDIYPVSYGRDESLGYETVRYKWKRPHVGWQDLVFRQAYLYGGHREFPTVIADQGIMLPSKKQTEGFQIMLRSYMEELRKKKSMTNIHGSMGWKNDFTQFVIGDKLYKREDDGSVVTEDISLASSANRMGRSMYGHKGTISAWSAGTKLLETANMPHHIFALNQTFGAPLWAFTGLKGITVSLCGGTGGGKTLIQLWMQSVWGNPEKLHFAAKFTQNALFNRLGVYCNLPMTIDEATMMEDVGDFCYWVTQGEDKKRLTRTADEREVKEWATSVTVSTNTSFISKMTAAGHETDAQMARLLEVKIPSHKMFSKSSSAGRTIFQHITAHYGVVGEAYAIALLTLGKEEILRRLAVATADFKHLYSCKFTGAERYWEQHLILCHVGCQIAKEDGLISYDFAIGIRWAIEQLGALRSSVQDNKTDGHKLIHEYLNESASHILTVMHTEGMKSSADPNRIPRGEVKARFDVYRKSHMDNFDKGTVMIVQKPFKLWVAGCGYDYNMLKGEVGAENIDATPATKRFWMGRNTSLKAGQQNVLGINLNHPLYLGYLDDIQLNADEMTLGQISEVTK